MYLVRRSFRERSTIKSAGSIVEPADIKGFKYRLNDRDVVEVNEQNFERYKDYFKQKFGIDIPGLPETTAEVKQEAPVEPNQEMHIEPEQEAPEQETVAEPEEAKQVVKAAAQVAKAQARVK